jgi:hypothetical protein
LRKRESKKKISEHCRENTPQNKARSNNTTKAQHNFLDSQNIVAIAKNSSKWQQTNITALVSAKALPNQNTHMPTLLHNLPINNLNKAGIHSTQNRQSQLGNVPHICIKLLKALTNPASLNTKSSLSFMEGMGSRPYSTL